MYDSGNSSDKNIFNQLLFQMIGRKYTGSAFHQFVTETPC